MPHSLRVKIKGLRYKGIITDKDCDRLCKALDNEDVLDKIRAEIEQMPSELTTDGRRMVRRGSVFRVIEKYKAESEIHCNCTDKEIAKSFTEDVEAVKNLLPRAESEG